MSSTCTGHRDVIVPSEASDPGPNKLAILSLLLAVTLFLFLNCSKPMCEKKKKKKKRHSLLNQIDGPSWLETLLPRNGCGLRLLNGRAVAASKT